MQNGIKEYRFKVDVLVFADRNADLGGCEVMLSATIDSSGNVELSGEAIRNNVGMDPKLLQAAISGVTRGYEAVLHHTNGEPRGLLK